MPGVHLRNPSTPDAARFKEWGQQKEQGAARQQETGNVEAGSRVSPQADHLEADPAKANGPAVPPDTFTSTASRPQAAAQPGTSARAGSQPQAELQPYGLATDASQPQAALQAGGSSALQQQIDAAALSKDWKKPAPVMQQTTLDNCGAAAVAMLARSAGSFGEKDLTDADLIARIGSGYVNREGPGGIQVQDMGHVMNNAGLVVDSAASPEGEEVEGYMLDRLKSGQKLVALLDGHTLEGVQGAGVSPHWVVIDGVDDNGRFVVKDPALGQALSVDAATIRASMEANQGEKLSSGFLAVEPKNQFGVDRPHGLINGPAGVGPDPFDNGRGIGTRVGTSSGTRESTLE